MVKTPKDANNGQSATKLLKMDANPPRRRLTDCKGRGDPIGLLNIQSAHQEIWCHGRGMEERIMLFQESSHEI